MALRVLLLGLVACLGLDLPSVETLEGWKETGRGWVTARMADLSSLRALAGLDEDIVIDPPAETASSRVDLAFEAALEGMTSGFSADLASARLATPVEEKVAAVEPEPDPASEVEAEPASRLDRISTAVRLTRQAVDAWASLIQPTAEREADDDRGNSL
jgi:hypothetical protein